MSVKLATSGTPPFDLELYVHDLCTNFFTIFFSTKSYVYFNKQWKDLLFSGVYKRFVILYESFSDSYRINSL